MSAGLSSESSLAAPLRAAASSPSFDPGGEAALRVDSLRKVFGRSSNQVVAVDDVSFSIHRGETVGLLGENGAGKTTILKCVSGLVTPTSGSIRVAGFPLSRKRSRALRHIAAVLEGNRNLYWRLTALENLDFFAGLHGVMPRRARREGLRLLDLVGLAEKRDVVARKLSRGMQQKLAVACALIPSTDVVLLDEPTLGLDITSVREFKSILMRSGRESERTFVVSSHDMDFVRSICDRVIIVHEGRVVADRGVADLLALFQTRTYEVRVRQALGGICQERIRARFPGAHIAIQGSETGLRVNELGAGSRSL